MDLEISTSWKWQKDPNIWSRCKVEIHGAEEIERDILCSSKKKKRKYFLVWPAAIAHSKMLRNYLPLRGQRSFTLYKLLFISRPKLENEHV